MVAPPAPPRLQLLTGPAGCGKTHEALERVREAATTVGPRGRGARRGGDVLLVVPTYAQALHVARGALSKWGARAVLDDPFVTFTSAGERFLDGYHVRALPSLEERDALMEAALERAAVPAFAGVADRPGFRARLLRLVKEVKQSGRAPAEEQRRLAAVVTQLEEDGRERLEGFLAVFAAYEALLQASALEDHEDTLRRLLETLRGQPPARPPKLVVVDGFDDFTPVEQAILDVLTDVLSRHGGEVLVTLPWDERRPALFAASVPARTHFLGRGFVETRLRRFRRAPEGTLADVAERVFAPWDANAVPTVPDGSLVAVVAGDPEDEAEAIAREARRLMRDGLLRGWRDLGVVVRRLDEAGPRIAAALDRMRVPHRLVGAGRPLGGVGPVRALAGPLGVLAGGVDAGAFEPTSLASWLRWRAHALGDDDALDRIDGVEVEWRRHGFPADWETWLAAAEAAGLDARPLETWRHRLAHVRGPEAVFTTLTEACLDLAPLPRAGGLDAVGRPRDPVADERRRWAAVARDRLAGALGDVARATRHRRDADATDARAAVAALEDALAHARAALPDRRLDAVSLLDAEEARFWELPIVFVAGLAQGLFPLPPREDVLLSDGERERLCASDASLSLPLARDLEVRERRLFYGALTRARRRVVLFRPGCDADGDARPPSSFLRDLERVVRLEVATERRPPARPAPRADECFTVGDLSLHAAALTGRDADTASAEERALALALLAATDDGQRQRAARWRRPRSDRIRSAGSAERFTRSVSLVSASALNVALLCRHRYFLRYVVGLPEDDVPFEGPAFAARDQGILIHDALRLAVLHPSRSPEDVVREALDAAASRPGPATPDGIQGDLERRELVRVVRLMREREARLPDVLGPLPDGLELSFGRAGDVVLGAGDRAFAIRGQIDRVDAAGRRAVVIDYKRAAGSVEGARKAWADGLDVQLPLYAAVVERELDLEVVAFEWVAATSRSRRGCWNEAAGELRADRRESGPLDELPTEAFRALLAETVLRAGETVQAVRGGDHAKQLEDAAHCGRCPWRTVCRPGILGRRSEGGGA